MLCPAGTGPGGTGTVVPGGGAGTASVPYTAVTRWFHPPVACSTVDASVKQAGPILRGTPLANRCTSTAIRSALAGDEVAGRLRQVGDAGERGLGPGRVAEH